jgi:hypothetical protein
MKKLNLILACILCIHALQAQHFKASIVKGIGIDGNKKNDSLFFAKSYNTTQFKVGYHYGKLGLVSSTTIINQKDTKDSLPLDERTPIFVSQFPRKYSNVQTINTTLGLELCLPIAKQMNVNLYAGYGLSFSKSDSVVFKDVTPAYMHKASGSKGCMQLGASLNYKYNKHLGIKWQNDLLNYAIKYNEIDVRKIPTNSIGSQAKKLFTTAIGLQYIF